jgi:hypothetical protein
MTYGDRKEAVAMFRHREIEARRLNNLIKRYYKGENLKLKDVDWMKNEENFDEERN